MTSLTHIYSGAHASASQIQTNQSALLKLELQLLVPLLQAAITTAALLHVRRKILSMMWVQASSVIESVCEAGVRAREALVICKQLHATLAALEPGNAIVQARPLPHILNP